MTMFMSSHVTTWKIASKKNPFGDHGSYIAFSESDTFLFSALPFPNPHIIMELDTHTKNSKY